MGRFGIGFNTKGRFTAFPEVFTNINADNLDLRPVSPLGIVAILGQGAGFFPPGVATSLPMAIGSPRRFLTTSELLTATELAVKPFAELDRGVGEVLVVPVNKSTVSTKALNTSVPALVATLTSEFWGLKANEITVKHELISTVPRLTLNLPTATTAIVEVYDYVAGQVQGLVDAINGRSALCTAVLATGQGAATIANFAAVAMTGGTEPAAVTADWDDALRALDGRKITAIAPITPTGSIHATVGAYLIAKRIRGFVGGAVQNWNGVSNRATAIAALKAAAAALNAPRIMHVGLGLDGQPGYITAARYAALAATLEPSVPMTFKHLDAAAIETRLDLQTEVGGIDGLLLAGVAPPVPDPDSLGTFLVSRGLSTWSGDDNLYRREHSVLAAVDAIQDLIEAGLRRFLGGEGTPGTVRRAINVIDQTLNDATKPTSIVRINGYKRESITASFTSDTVMHVTANVTPIPPINFINVNLNLDRTDIQIDFDANLTP